MKNLLISAAVGDIAGSAYEGKGKRIKDYDKVKMFSSRAHFTDDTVLTFACAEAFIDHLDMKWNLWNVPMSIAMQDSAQPSRNGLVPTIHSHIAVLATVLPCAAHQQAGWQKRKKSAS